MATFKDGSEAVIGNIVRGTTDKGKLVQGMLSDIRPDGTATVIWLTSTPAPGGFTHIGTESAVLKLTECEKLAEDLLDSLVADEKPKQPESSPVSLEAGCLFRGRLTKGVAMTIPEGCIVQSNTYSSRGTPIAVEKVGSMETRGELWKKLRSLRVSKHYLQRMARCGGVSAFCAAVGESAVCVTDRYR